MIHLSRETETLARRLAETRGISPEEAVKLALEEASGADDRVTYERGILDKEVLLRRMEEISARCAARPLVDPRSPDELLGYDDFGLPG